jgi:hypothetical protein
MNMTYEYDRETNGAIFSCDSCGYSTEKVTPAKRPRGWKILVSHVGFGYGDPVDEEGDEPIEYEEVENTKGILICRNCAIKLAIKQLESIE